MKHPCAYCMISFWVGLVLLVAYYWWLKLMDKDHIGAGSRCCFSTLRVRYTEEISKERGETKRIHLGEWFYRFQLQLSGSNILCCLHSSHTCSAWHQFCSELILDRDHLSSENGKKVTVAAGWNLKTYYCLVAPPDRNANPVCF